MGGRQVPQRDHLVDVRPLASLGERPPLLAQLFELSLETGAILEIGTSHLPPQLL